jgi:hypothetical protein
MLGSGWERGRELGGKRGNEKSFAFPLKKVELGGRELYFLLSVPQGRAPLSALSSTEDERA